MKALIGKKVGMTQIFDEAGVVIPVTVSEAGPCPLLDIKNQERDGYSAVQLGFGKKKAKNISLGYFGKAETLDKELKNCIIEFVLRWRYEKSFQNVEHYKKLIARVEVTPE